MPSTQMPPCSGCTSGKKVKIGKKLFKINLFNYLRNNEKYSLDSRLYISIQFGLVALFLFALIIEIFLNHYPGAKFVWVLGVVFPIISAEIVLRERFLKIGTNLSIIFYTILVFLGIHFSGSILTPSTLFSFLGILILSVIAKGILKYISVLAIISFVVNSAINEMNSNKTININQGIYVDWIVYFSVIALIVMWIVSRILTILKEYEDAIKKANIELYHNSITDPLTGIFNRYYFNEYTNHLLNDRRGNSSFYAILMVDIDFFKQYNDYYGHIEGDNCLKIVASTLKQSLFRSDDIVFRIGGEEFLAFINVVKKENLGDISRRIHDKLANKKIEHKMSTVSSYVTVSIGAVSFDISCSKDINDILRVADAALYKAKETGKNKTVEVIYPEERGGLASLES